MKFKILVILKTGVKLIIFRDLPGDIMALVQWKCLNQLKHLYKYDNSGVANSVFSDFFNFFFLTLTDQFCPIAIGQN